MWYHNGTIPKFFRDERFTVSAYQRRVNHPRSLPRSKITARVKMYHFPKSHVFLRISTFGVKIVKNNQTSNHSTNRTRSHRQACDIAFESWALKLFSPKSFGYHGGMFFFCPIFWKHRATIKKKYSKVFVLLFFCPIFWKNRAKIKK